MAKNVCWKVLWRYKERFVERRNVRVKEGVVEERNAGTVYWRNGSNSGGQCGWFEDEDRKVEGNKTDRQRQNENKYIKENQQPG